MLSCKCQMLKIFQKIKCLRNRHNAAIKSLTHLPAVGLDWPRDKYQRLVFKRSDCFKKLNSQSECLNDKKKKKKKKKWAQRKIYVNFSLQLRAQNDEPRQNVKETQCIVYLMQIYFTKLV